MIGTFQRGHDGLPVPNQEMQQVSAMPIGAGGDGRMLRTPDSSPSHHTVYHEYGEARTTSMIQPAFSNGSDRASWWGRMSGMLGNAGGSHNRIDDHPIGQLDHSNLSYESAVDAFNAPNCPSSRAPRRPQITRGADGLVSGIGRPVLRENSLFF